MGRALRARRLVGTTGVQRTARPTGTRAFGLFAGDIENDAETRFAAHHSLVRLGGSFQRKNFVHGMDVRQRTKFECILRIDGRSRVPSFDGPTASDKQNRIDRERSCRADYDKHTVRGKTAEDCCHCFGIRHSRDHNFRAAKFIQFRGRIGSLAVDVVVCAEFFGELLPCPFRVQSPQC